MKLYTNTKAKAQSKNGDEQGRKTNSRVRCDTLKARILVHGDT